jgi:hypothetical protein
MLSAGASIFRGSQSEAVVVMGSLLEELARREAAARRRAEQIRQQIVELSQRLAAEDELVSRLLITRETVEQVLGEAGQPAESPREESDSGPARSQGSPIGVLTVPPWRPGMDGSVLPQAYRDVLEVLVDAGKPLRAGHLAAALGLGEGAGKIEGLRSKLKRLVARGWLSEDSPGKFEVTGQVTKQITGRGGSGSGE